MSIRQVFSKDYFQGRTSNYGLGYTQKKPLDLSLMKRYRKLLSKGKGLDLCCGNGYWLATFRKLAEADAVGIDISDWMLRKDVYGNKDSSIVGDARKLPFRESCFAWVFCNQSLEHFRAPDEVVSEVFKVLDGTGVAFITVPHKTLFSRFVDKDRTHFSLKTLREWKRLLEVFFSDVDVFAWYDENFYDRNFALLPLIFRRLFRKFLPIYCYVFICRKQL